MEIIPSWATSYYLILIFISDWNDTFFTNAID